jgi:hypothetical protein
MDCASPRVVRTGKNGVMTCAVGTMNTGSAVTKKVKVSATRHINVLYGQNSEFIDVKYIF